MPKKTPATRRRRLNVQACNAIDPPAEGRVYVYDTEADHLALCVTSTGRRTWYWYGRSNGRPHRERLGRFPEIKPHKARDLARQRTGRVAEGVDLAEQGRSRRADLTLGDAYQRFRDEPSAKTKRPKRPATLQFYDALFAEPRPATETRKGTVGGPLHPWKGRRLKSITQRQLQGLHGEIAEARGTYLANRCVAAVKAIYNMARSRWGYAGDNPAVGVELGAERSRVRYLRQDEAARFMAALHAEQTDPAARDAIKLLLLTGARKGNVLAMRWEDIDVASRAWTIPHDQAKHGEAMTITLTPEAVAVLQHRRSVSDPEAMYVFPSSRAVSGHMPDICRAMQDVLRRAEIRDFRVHDLRHTLASWMAASGVGLPIIGRQLGHKSAATTHKYAHVDLEAVRGAVDGAVGSLLGVGK